MGYLICKNCGDYYELQPGETANDFDKCQCGGKLIYRKHLDNNNDRFNDASLEKSSKNKLPINSKLIKPLGIGILFIFGLLIKFHAFNFVMPYLAHSDFISSSPTYLVILIALGLFLSYLGKFVR
ncbi:MAG: hypothetical protein ACPK7O_03580 [Methanobacterium sp.]